MPHRSWQKPKLRRLGQAFFQNSSAGGSVSGLSLVQAQEYTLLTLAGPNESAPCSIDGPAALATFRDPVDLAVDAAGNIYVADSGNHAIRKISPAGLVTTLAGGAPAASPTRSPKGGFADGIGPAAPFFFPQAVGVDGAGFVYVADSRNYVIRKIDPAGMVTTLAGEAGHPGRADSLGTAARFYRPKALVTDATGNIYGGDGAFSGDRSAIRKITPAGEVTTLAGSPLSKDGAGPDARFGLASGLAAMPDGTICVADYESHTIRKIDPGGAVTTLHPQDRFRRARDHSLQSAEDKRKMSRTFARIWRRRSKVT